VVSWTSRVAGAALGLPPADTPVKVERDLKVPMADGTILLADRYHAGTGAQATILVRSPYGRRGFYGLLNGRLFAERGFQVVVQSCRGTSVRVVASCPS